MQVTDCEQLMRATLRAASILTTLRGMQPMGVAGYDIDLHAWLQRAEWNELLGELAHRDVARAFFVEMLSNTTRATLMPSGDAPPPEPDAKTAAAVARGANQRMPQRQVFATGTDLVVLERLMASHTLFIGRLHPIAFIAPPDAPRPHAGLRYRLALLVHAGLRVVSIKQTILASLDCLRRLRQAHAELLGGEQVPARLFVVIWGWQFHPRFPGQTTILHTALNKVSASVAAEHITIETHHVLELQYDVTRNARVPLHTAVDRATEPGIATIRDAEFRTMLLNDVQVRVHDFAVGQIVRVDRTDLELGGDPIEYYMVRRKAGT